MDNNNKIIKEYISIKQASEELNMDRETVRDTCNNVWEKPKYNLKFKKDYEYLEKKRLSEKGFIKTA